MARKSKKRGDILSALAMSRLLGRDRMSLVRWADEEGCPFEERPDENGAGEWKFASALVIDWLLEREIEKAVAKIAPLPADPAGSDPDQMTEAEADAMKARWDAHRSKFSALLQEMKTREAADELVEIGQVAGVVSRRLMAVRQRLLELDARISAKIPNPDDRVFVAEMVRDEVNELLAEVVALMDEWTGPDE